MKDQNTLPGRQLSDDEIARLKQLAFEEFTRKARLHDTMAEERGHTYHNMNRKARRKLMSQQKRSIDNK